MDQYGGMGTGAFPIDLPLSLVLRVNSGDTRSKSGKYTGRDLRKNLIAKALLSIQSDLAI